MSGSSTYTAPTKSGITSPYTSSSGAPSFTPPPPANAPKQPYPQDNPYADYGSPGAYYGIDIPFTAVGPSSRCAITGEGCDGLSGRASGRDPQGNINEAYSDAKMDGMGRPRTAGVLGQPGGAPSTQPTSDWITIPADKKTEGPSAASPPPTTPISGSAPTGGGVTPTAPSNNFYGQSPRPTGFDLGAGYPMVGGNRWGLPGGAPNGPGATFPGNPMMAGNRPMAWGMGSRYSGGMPALYNMNRFNPAYSGFGSLPVMNPQMNIGGYPMPTMPQFAWNPIDRSMYTQPSYKGGDGSGGDSSNPMYGSNTWWNNRMNEDAAGGGE